MAGPSSGVWAGYGAVNAHRGANLFGRSLAVGESNNSLPARGKSDVRQRLTGAEMLAFDAGTARQVGDAHELLHIYCTGSAPRRVARPSLIVACHD